MRPEALLATTAIVVLLTTVAVALIVPGFVATPESDSDEPPPRLDVTETTLETTNVTGETATFEVTAFLTHRGGTAENVSLVVRAVDDSGLLADTAREERRTLESGNEHEIPASVTVPREGGYEIRTILYVDGDRVDVARASVSGVEALTPPYARSNVGFQELGQQPAVEHAIDSVENGSVTLDVTSYLTNGGDEPESDLQLTVTARQADANVVVDRAETSVGAIAAGRTTFVDVPVTVRDESNYYLDVTLWRDGVVIDSTRTVANLDPQRTVDVEEETESIGFEAGEFESDRGDRPVPEPEPEPEPEDQAGFGAVVALVALLLGTAAAGRWSK